jgi:integrase
MNVKLLSIYKPNDRKNYMAIFMHNGIRKKKSLKTANRKDAYKFWEEYEEVLKSQEDSSFQFNISQGYDLSAVIKKFLIWRANRIQASSYKADKWHIGKFQKHIRSLGIKEPGSIQATHIDDFIETLEEEGRSNKTINNYISLINIMLNYFVKRGYIVDNCVDTKTLWRRRSKSKINFITMDEARMIIEQIQKLDEMEYRLFMLGPFYTGLRYSEIKALRKRNIDFDKRILHIAEKQTLDDPKPTKLLKSRAAYRRVPILKDFMPVLKEYVECVRSEYIFKSISYKTMYRLKGIIAQKTGIPFRYHDARHFFASVLINNGFDLKKIQYILGHESVQMTVDIYGHLLEKINAEDFDCINF